MTLSGLATAGDFDQYSEVGVDFGTDFTEDFGIVPNNLQGEPLMFSSEFDQLGVVPEGLGHYQQLGSHHQQLGGYHQQLGHSQHHQMGGTIFHQMGSFIDDAKLRYSMMSPTMKAAVLGVAAVGALVALKKAGLVKAKLPFIG